jgi:excisionase family DNA binding protein
LNLAGEHPGNGRAKPMTYAEVCEHTGLALNTVRKMVADGKLVPIDLGPIRRFLFDPEHVREVFSARPQRAAGGDR